MVFSTAPHPNFEASEAITVVSHGRDNLAIPNGKSAAMTLASAAAVGQRRWRRVRESDTKLYNDRIGDSNERANMA